jgi:nicotinate-nucleotide--dimethylbenzimidazole phosphoribosyltransferase
MNASYVRSHPSWKGATVLADLENVLRHIEPLDAEWARRAETRQAALTKPPGSLGRLEELANRVVTIQRSLTPRVERARIVVFAADHGVTAEGVAPYPSAVTGQMVANFLAGGAGVNALARVAGAEVHVVDIGVGSDLRHVAGVHQRRVASGTRNMAREPAMTRDQADAAIAVGLEMGRDAIAAGVDMIGLGEMGIGNSTAASAVTAALTGLPVASVTGRGTGADDVMLAHKVSVIECALQRHRPDPADAFDVLVSVGGFELAGLAGVVLAGAAGRKVVVTDGFIATAAAALAVRMCPAAGDYLVAAHRSPEPGHTALLTMIGQEPLLDLRMRLGEGTGAALAFTLIRAAVAAFTEMATFASASVSNRSDVPDAVV